MHLVLTTLTTSKISKTTHISSGSLHLLHIKTTISASHSTPNYPHNWPFPQSSCMSWCLFTLKMTLLLRPLRIMSRKQTYVYYLEFLSNGSPTTKIR